MASAFYVGRHYDRMQREAASQRMRDDEAFVKDVLKRFGNVKAGQLSFEQTRNWFRETRHAGPCVKRNDLQDHFPGIYSSLELLDNAIQSSPDSASREQVWALDRPDDVIDDEVVWVMKSVMEKSAKGSFRRTVMDQGIDVHELKLHSTDFKSALRFWLGYLECKPRLLRAAIEFGANVDLRFNRQNVAAMMSRLDTDAPSPRDSDVDWLMQVRPSISISSEHASKPVPTNCRCRFLGI